MTSSIDASREFLHFANRLNLSRPEDQQLLVKSVRDSFQVLSECNAGNTSSIDHRIVESLRPILFDSETHALKLEPAPGYFSNTIPGFVWRWAGYKEPAPGPQNLADMVNFIAKNLAVLAKLKLGEGEGEGETFAKFLLENYSSASWGINYLEAYYRRFVFNSYQQQLSLQNCSKLLESSAAAAALIGNYSTEEIAKLTKTIFLRDRAYDLLALKVYSPIRKLLSIGGGYQGSSQASYIRTVFSEDKCKQFLDACLRIQPELYPAVIKPLLKDLKCAYNDQYSSPNESLNAFYLRILKSEHFEAFHLDAVQGILKNKEWKATDSTLDARCSTEPMQEAFAYIRREVQKIKTGPLSTKEKEEKIAALLRHLSELSDYPPYRQIYAFIHKPWDKPAPENNPGLPFYAIGSGELSAIVARVLLSFDDLGDVNLADPVCRKILLKCAEPWIIDRFNRAGRDKTVDLLRLENWLKLFPQITDVVDCWPIIQQFCADNNIDPWALWSNK